MGQLLDYLTNIFSSNNQAVDDGESNNRHVTFADNSFAQRLRRSGSKAQPQSETELATLKQSNRKTIYTYMAISGLACLVHLCVVTLPKFKLDDFDLLQPDGWQMVTLSVIPVVVHLASIGAMSEFSRPLDEASKLTTKNSNLNLNENDYIQSLKIIIILMAMCQMSSIVSDQLLWSTIMIIPLWCYQLSSKMARTENERFAPSPKKSWVQGLKSPGKSPTKPPSTPVTRSKSADRPPSVVKNTPRTRTKRAVKNIITGVSDKYHAFEQNMAHQISKNIFTPLSPKPKMLEPTQ